MSGENTDLTKKRHQINQHGTTVEQLPTPSDSEVKVLSAEMLDFVQNHPEYTLREVSFSLWGQIEQEYITSKDILNEFDKPQATIETINGKEKVITHYTTGAL